MENNQAFFATLKNIRPLQGADNIVQADVTLKNIVIASIVVGKDTVEGQEVVYFDSNLCLSDALVKEYEELGRYLGRNNRVKSVKFNKFNVISTGLAVNFDKFLKFDKKLTFKEGESFLTIGSTTLCSKYIAPVVHVNAPGVKRKVKSKIKILPNQFKFHIDTKQMARNIAELNYDDVVSITNKLHGTSAIYSKPLVQRNLNIFEKILKAFGVKIQENYYKFICASRTVIKTENDQSGFYDEDIWTKTGVQFKDLLRDGETIYGEIVGQLESGKAIQAGYTYGLPLKTSKFYLYRVTQTDSNGNVIEHGWASLKERALELNVDFVPEFYFGKLGQVSDTLKKDEHFHENLLSYLKETYLEKTRTDCNGRPDEGIVVRKESSVIQSYKLKSELFFAHETAQYEKGEEEIES